MIRKLVILLAIPLIYLSLMGSSISVSNIHTHFPDDVHVAAASTSTPMLIPTDTPTIIEVNATQSDRTLPPVGGNAGLVFGASVLVLIIIGGVVLTSRRRPKH